MAIKFVVNYKVNDFEIWKEKFYSNSVARESAGIKESPFKTVDYPQVVCIIGEAPSKPVLEGMFLSPKMKEPMKVAGVISKPNLTFLDGQHHSMAYFN